MDPRISVMEYHKPRAMAIQYCGRMLSVNIPGVSEKLPANHFCVKTWSENAGLAKEAMNSGLFVETDIKIPTGFVVAPVWRLKEDV